MPWEVLSVVISGMREILQMKTEMKIIYCWLTICYQTDLLTCTTLAQSFVIDENKISKLFISRNFWRAVDYFGHP